MTRMEKEYVVERRLVGKGFLRGYDVPALSQAPQRDLTEPLLILRQLAGSCGRETHRQDRTDYRVPHSSWLGLSWMEVVRCSCLEVDLP